MKQASAPLLISTVSGTLLLGGTKRGFQVGFDMSTESFVNVANRGPFIVGCDCSPPEWCLYSTPGGALLHGLSAAGLTRQHFRSLKCCSAVSVRLDRSAGCALLAARRRDYRKRIRSTHHSRQPIRPPCIRQWLFVLRIEDPRRLAGVHAQVRCAMHRRLRASEVCDSHRWACTVSGGVSCPTVVIGLLGRPSSTPQCSNLDDQQWSGPHSVTQPASEKLISAVTAQA
jgi:hypothetical protein